MNATVSVVAASSWATFCGSVDGCSRARRSSPIGVERKAAHRFDDAIELERPQDGWMHQVEIDETAKGERRGISHSICDRAEG